MEKYSYFVVSWPPKRKIQRLENLNNTYLRGSKYYKSITSDFLLHVPGLHLGFIVFTAEVFVHCAHFREI
jgi:hypothetical protein